MANARLNITDLDFDQIKSNLKTYLQQQSQFQDYDFEGAGLSVLLDILAYNTHYNSYYLNMVANESFLDTALLRDSVVSHAKTLGYVPHSSSSPKSVVNVTVDTANTTPGTLTITRGTSFSSDLVDGVSYNFVVLTDVSVTKSDTKFYFENLDIYEGALVNYDYNYSQLSNPKSVFILPDRSVDTSTITVSVRPNPGNTSSAVYTKSTDILDITSTSDVYFLQEGKNTNYQIYFGDGVLGKALDDGSVISVSYLVTRGDAANKSNAFIPNSMIGGISNIVIDVVNVASGGSTRETVDSIKFGASSQFLTQNRLVTFKDYESYLKKNYPSVDSLSVWGGEDQSPPAYGKVFISLKPKENYFITETEKLRIVNEIIKPKSIVAVTAEIIDPEYLYILIENYVQYDKTKTTLSPIAIKNAIRSSLLNYRDTFLNKFDATFVLSKMQDYIDSVDLNSIAGSETILRIQKRFEPTLGVGSTYRIEYNTPLHRGTTTNKLTSSLFDVNDIDGVLRSVILEETPESFTGLSEILVTNAGSGYTTAPTVTITGDGVGATASAVVVNGRIQSIAITNRGINYSRAIITVSGGNGYGCIATAVLDGRYGTLRIVYFDGNAERQIVNSNAGSIDYDTGLIILTDLKIISLATFDNLVRLTIESEKGIIKSFRNTIITLDEADTTSITTELVES
jgi:hypothetical protein